MPSTTTLPDSAHLRVCAVEFLNAWPLVRPLAEPARVTDPGGPAPPRFALETALPSICARRLANEECDIALIPVASYAAHPTWDIVPEIGIGCEGPVETVVLESEVPLAQIETIHLDAASRSSATLIRVLMHERGLRPRYTVAPHREGVARVRGRDAALIIGDAAFGLRGRFAHHYDLGQMWLESTGLPFVFAFWAARAGLVARAPRHIQALIDARADGHARLQDYAERYREFALSAPNIEPGAVLSVRGYREYLERTIRYDLDARARAGLRLFLQKVRELGLDAELRADLHAARRQDRPRAGGDRRPSIG